MSTQSHLSLTDEAFLNHVESGTLNPALFSHEAHLRLAFLQISNLGLKDAIDQVNRQILNYVIHLGVQDKYNKTLTTAAVHAVHHFMSRAPSLSFEGLILRFPRLKYQFNNLMKCHYSIDIYNNPKAKEKYLEPDLLSFS